MDSRRHRSTAIFIPLLAAMLALTGCEGGNPLTGTEPGQKSASEEDLRKRPTFDEMKADQAVIADKVKAAIDAELPGHQWETTGEWSRTPCSEAQGDVRGAWNSFTPVWFLRARPTQEQWGRIKSHVRDIVKEYGYEEVTRDFATNGGAVYTLAGPYRDSRFTMAFDKTVTLSVISGCVLESK